MLIKEENESRSKISVSIQDGRVCVEHYRFGICFEKRSFSAVDLVDAGFAEKMLNSMYGTFDLDSREVRK